MSVVNMIRTIKQVHKTEVTLVKMGDFYHAYGKDAYILAYLFGYKLKMVEGQKEELPTCGFPEKSLAKIEATLEQKKINYMLIDRRNNYEVDEVTNFKNLNNYEKIFDKAYSYIKQKQKLDKIYEYFLKNLQKDDVKKMINEIERKIIC